MQHAWRVGIQAVTLSCGLVASAQAASQNDTGQWDLLMHKADVASTKHDIPAAIALYREALLAAQRFDLCDERRAKNLENLGKELLHTQQFAKAETVFKQLLAMRLQCLPSADGRIAVALQHLGDANVGLNQLDRAELFYRREIQLLEKTFGPQDRVLPVPLDRLADCLRLEKKYPEFDQISLRALEIRTELMGADSPGLLKSLGFFAETCLQTGSLKNAEKYAAQALSIVEKNFGKTSDQCVQPLLLLGRTYIGQGHPAEAERFIRKALSIGRANSAEITRNTVLAKQALVECYDSQDKFEQADAVFKEVVHDWLSLETGRNAFYHFADERGQKLCARQKNKESLDCYRFVLDTDGSMPADVKSTFIHGVGINQVVLHNYAEAEKQYKKLLEYLKNGPQEKLADPLTVLGFIYCNERKLAEAEQCFEKARSILDAHPQPRNEYNWYKCKILLLSISKKIDEAKKLEQKQKEFGKKYPDAVF